MTLSQVIAALQKLTPLVGDAELVLSEVDSGAQTIIHSLSVDVSPTGDATGSTITVKHGASQAPPEPAPESAADAPEAGSAA
jgi:hypothetical protein